ncbi:S-adenosyl-L-methionine-dependent methyltransferase [Gilbertella persicaria]|uniref:S-adenosyl-L-methionine-dependent methyltransferase n=1 Tax=Gilbertella persicaria TaxID=101096 RepID=UPI00221F1598|nr:S-adenosyl-L-methionine-dependent methyltransferase [Gilbertella persicaria]KAI8092251.1 S-adenosyl-L-methionine-dependent methyltransferase [Gilbertella persicaria]
MTQPTRCLEFFSGIGGLHYALKIAEINADVVGAFDINVVANKVYSHNFHITPSKKLIDRLTVNDIEKYKADCWLLSPPCQPYTQGGNRKDMEDARSQGLLHLIDLLPQLTTIPTFIFLENVKNFEISQSREKLVRQLDELGYEINECLLTPLQFGIPNHRMRYYLTAHRKSDREPADYLKNNTIHTSWPFTGQPAEFTIPELSWFLETDNPDVTKKTLVPHQYITKLYKFRLDIVRPSDKTTTCVTKAYGSHHLQTSGSLVQTRHLDSTDYNFDDMSSLLTFGLRFLSPTEIARLHAFPIEPYQLNKTKNETTNSSAQPFYPPQCLPRLVFPDDVTQKQQYRLLGNSLNCWVVAELYRCVLFNPPK